MSSTQISWHINAPRAAVYRALLDARAVAKWKVPVLACCHHQQGNKHCCSCILPPVPYGSRSPLGCARALGHHRYPARRQPCGSLVGCRLGDTGEVTNPLPGPFRVARCDGSRAPLGHQTTSTNEPLFGGVALGAIGALIGFGIGVVASIMGVAGGELLIPTIVLVFGADLKLAGSLSLAVSLPTMIVGFSRYSRDKSFSVIFVERHFVLIMAAGSLIGAILGARRSQGHDVRTAFRKQKGILDAMLGKPSHGHWARERGQSSRSQPPRLKRGRYAAKGLPNRPTRLAPADSRAGAATWSAEI